LIFPKDYLFPEINFSEYPTGNGQMTQTQLNNRAAYLNPQFSSNIWFVNEGSINISIAADGGGYRNQMGYFLISPSTQLPISGSYKGLDNSKIFSLPFHLSERNQ